MINESNSMNILTLAAMMQASIVTFELQPYHDVYRNVTDDQKPFLVIIGADWCHACQRLKHKTVPEVANQGGFKGVEVAYVDVDRDAEMAKKLMKGTSIPQIVRFQPHGKKWDIERLSGSPSHQALKNFARGQNQPLPVLLTSTTQ